MNNEKILDALYQHPKMQTTEIFDRLNFLTHYFLGRPYIAGAQGEGPMGEFDQFPLYRFDGFDCVTFVNNLLALAISLKKVNFKNNLLKINYYDGEPFYQNRFHFMSLDWNPQNQKNHIVLDITQQIVDNNDQPIAAYAEGIIDKKNWFLHRTENDIRLLNGDKPALKLTQLQKLATLFQPKIVRMPYLPLQKLLENTAYLDQFPSMSIVEIVRPNWSLKDKIGTNLHVSHLGFCFRKPSGELIFRHASSDAKGVVEVLLKDYLLTCLKTPSVGGIHIHRVIPEKLNP